MALVDLLLVEFQISADLIKVQCEQRGDLWGFLAETDITLSMFSYSWCKKPFTHTVCKHIEMPLEAELSIVAEL